MSRDEAAYRAAEQRYWASEGTEPAELWLDLPSAGVKVRIQVVGEGPALLFVHGGSICGTSWAPLAARLTDRRCLLLDRPGCGLSERLPVRHDTADVFTPYADSLIVDVLDGLEIETVDVVATSFGGYFAMRMAAEHPSRLRRFVELGFPIGAPLGKVPTVMRLAALRGVGRLMTRMRVTERVARSMLRQIGLGAAMDAGRLPQEGIDWFRALLNDTDTMRNEIDGAPPVLRALRGANDSVLLSDEVLSRIRAPAHFLWGADDPFGGEEVATDFVASIPGATLEMMPRAGHALWLDDPDHTAATIRRFLAD